VLLLRLELDAGAGTVRGILEHRDGTREPFWGWLELMALLERAQDREDRSSAPA
jgi:hypothetical protein